MYIQFRQNFTKLFICKQKETSSILLVCLGVDIIAHEIYNAQTVLYIAKYIMIFWTYSTFEKCKTASAK